MLMYRRGAYESDRGIQTDHADASSTGHTAPKHSHPIGHVRRACHPPWCRPFLSTPHRQPHVSTMDASLQLLRAVLVHQNSDTAMLPSLSQSVLEQLPHAWGQGTTWCARGGLRVVTHWVEGASGSGDILRPYSTTWGLRRSLAMTWHSRISLWN